MLLTVRYCAKTCRFYFISNSNVKETCVQSGLDVRRAKMDTLYFFKILAGEVLRKINVNHAREVYRLRLRLVNMRKLVEWATI